MRLRPVGQMLTALGTLGVRVDDGGRGALPFAVHGTGSVPGGTVTIDASASSQFVSALLLAGARYDHGVDVRHVGKPVPSLPHIEMTLEALRQRGLRVPDDVSVVGFDDLPEARWSSPPLTTVRLTRELPASKTDRLAPGLAFVAGAAVSGTTITDLSEDADAQGT